jgi:D-serine deaminase-like pyridoxal phosphate-dependent protein
VTNDPWARRVEDLETPCPLVDLDRLDRNLDRMAAYAARHQLALRPHTKTHKSPRIGGEQLRRGAAGLTCATVLEAEVMAEVCDDILLAYPPVGAAKLHRLLSLPRNVAITVALDSAEAVEPLARAARVRERPVGVYVELDVGMRRVGVSGIEQALALARLVSQRESLIYRGITFYPGHIRGLVGEQTGELIQLGRDLGAAVEELARSGLRPEVVSGGSTPTAARAHDIESLTEIRPGTYVYNDRLTYQAGACGWDDCALTLLATVVSTAVPGQVVIDAGSKALGREPAARPQDGYAALLDRPEVTVQRLSEEHGILELGDSNWRPQVGERVRLVPNHVCIVVHLHEVVYGIRNGLLETSWPVVARGRRPLSSEVEV